MAENAEFEHGMQELERAKRMRASGGMLRGGVVGGAGYGLAAYGSPIGAVTGVQQPTPPQPPEQPLGEQFSGDMMSAPDGGGDAAAGGGAGDAGGAGDGGGGVSG